MSKNKVDFSLLKKIVKNPKSVVFEDIIHISCELYELKPYDKKPGKCTVINKKTKEEKEVSAFAISMYNLKKNIFRWNPPSKDSNLYKVLHQQFPEFKNIFDYIFLHSEFELDKQLKNGIPYLIGLIHNYNLIRFINEEFEIYYMIDLNINKEKEIIDFLNDLEEKNIKRMNKKINKKKNKRINKKN